MDVVVAAKAEGAAHHSECSSQQHVAGLQERLVRLAVVVEDLQRPRLLHILRGKRSTHDHPQPQVVQVQQFRGWASRAISR